MTWQQIISLIHSAKDLYTYNEDENSIGIDGYLYEKDFTAWRNSQPSLAWTTDKPTKKGYYWLRNVETRNGYSHQEPQIVDVYDMGNGFPGNFDVSIPSDECTTELRDISKGEWCGPITVPE